MGPNLLAFSLTPRALFIFSSFVEANPPVLQRHILVVFRTSSPNVQFSVGQFWYILVYDFQRTSEGPVFAGSFWFNIG